MNAIYYKLAELFFSLARMCLGQMNVPTPPDNFPADWDTEWQPSFDE